MVFEVLSNQTILGFYNNTQEKEVQGMVKLPVLSEGKEYSGRGFQRQWGGGGRQRWMRQPWEARSGQQWPGHGVPSRPQVLLALWRALPGHSSGLLRGVPGARTLLPCIPRACTCPSETCLSTG